LKDAQLNILKALVYFDIFHYPITADEIRSFLPVLIDNASLDNALELLVSENVIFKVDNFYSLQNDKSLIERRCNGNRLAKKKMGTAAVKAATILSCFPYVQALAVSGSLSKNFADEKTDIDFFIITKANRLWIARTIMHLFKKFSFLVGKQDWFCMNYYIDDSILEIPEKNIFTAMEIVTLIPMYGHEALSGFFNSNEWAKNYFPVKKSSFSNLLETKNGLLKRMVEKIFNNKLGNVIDDKLMKLTDKRWQKKTEQRRVNEKGIRMGMKAGKHFSKPDPKNFQNKVIREYESKLKHMNTIAVENYF
jgi:hypothetical protein